LVEGSGSTAVPGALLPTPDLEQECAFLLKTLGFSALGGEPGRWAALRLARPVPAWSCDLWLAAAPPAAPAFLDSRGFPCLAFHSSNLGQDAERLREHGATDLTAPFRSLVNGRCLAILLFRTPSGMLGELIQVQR